MYREKNNKTRRKYNRNLCFTWFSLRVFFIKTRNTINYIQSREEQVVIHEDYHVAIHKIIYTRCFKKTKIIIRRKKKFCKRMNFLFIFICDIPST